MQCEDCCATVVCMCVLPVPAGMQRWSDAVDCFNKATTLSRDFSFAAANKALAMYQLGNTEEAIRWEAHPQTVGGSFRCLHGGDMASRGNDTGQ